MADGNIRMAVIGVGYFGSLHAKKIAAIDGARLVAVVDIQPGRAAEVAAQPGIRAATSHLDVLDDIDAAVVATPSETHAAVVGDLLRAGKDVLCEKPMTLTVSQSDSLVRLAEEKGCILQVGHLERFNPAVEELIKRIDSPAFIDANRIAPIKRRSLDTSIILDLMIHDLDIVLALMGREPREVRASGAPVVGPRPDIVNARLEFPGGCVANLTASRLALKEERRMRVFQADSYLTADFHKAELVVVNKVRFRENGQPEIGFDRPQLSNLDPLEEELKSFAACIRNRAVPRVPGVQAATVMKYALLIQEKVDEALAGRENLLDRPGHWVGLET